MIRDGYLGRHVDLLAACINCIRVLELQVNKIRKIALVTELQERYPIVFMRYGRGTIMNWLTLTFREGAFDDYVLNNRGILRRNKATYDPSIDCEAVHKELAKQLRQRVKRSIDQYVYGVH